MSILNSNIDVGCKLGAKYFFKFFRQMDTSLDCDYISYPAPLLGIAKHINDDRIKPKKMRPHSILVSLASKARPHLHILDKIKDEISITNSGYLGEHIGLLNTSSVGPSLGYIFPPKLTEESACQIAKNVKFMQEYLEKPLALENPVIYAEDPLDLSWAKFIKELHLLLPKECGWLIDIAHLTVTNHNLKSGSLEDSLCAYATTQRKILEWHIASTKTDMNGIQHDDHASKLNLLELSSILKKANFLRLIHDSTNLTIERELASNQGFIDLSSDISALKTLVRDLLSDSKDVQIEIQKGKTPDAIIFTNAEVIGRSRILIERIQQDLENCLSPQEFENLIYLLGFSNQIQLGMYLLSEFSKEKEYTSIPLYTWKEPENFDLLGPFYHFLLKKHLEDDTYKSLVRRILVRCAIRKAKSIPFIKDAGQIRLTLKGKTEHLSEGSYHLTHDAGNIVATPVTDESSEHIFLFSEGETITTLKGVIE